MLKGRLRLITTRRRNVFLGLNGIVQEGLSLVLAELNCRRLSSVQPITIREGCGRICSWSWPILCGLGRFIDEAWKALIAELCGRELTNAAWRSLVRSRSGETISAQVQSTTAPGRLLSSCARLALVKKLILERHQSLDSLDVPIQLLFELISPESIHPVNAVSLCSDIHEMKVLLLAAKHPAPLLILPSSSDISDALLDLQQLLLTLQLPLDLHVLRSLLHLRHLCSVHIRFLITELSSCFQEPLHSFLFGNKLSGKACLSLFEVCLLLIEDVLAPPEPGVQILPGSLRYIRRMCSSCLPARLALFIRSFELFLFHELVSVVLDEDRMLAELSLEVHFQPFRLLVEEVLQHREELRALHTWDLSLASILCNHLCSFGKHLAQPLLASLLVVVVAQLLLVLEVAGHCKGLIRPEV
mmetsp:Transcript_62269/g.148618  ORF Transcript_62269/g.148618 Transcript_62269/m.148618 type:complete len:415 (+) Transcript_62269:467-1711(+)